VVRYRRNLPARTPRGEGRFATLLRRSRRGKRKAALKPGPASQPATSERGSPTHSRPSALAVGTALHAPKPTPNNRCVCSRVGQQSPFQRDTGLKLRRQSPHAIDILPDGYISLVRFPIIISWLSLPNVSGKWFHQWCEIGCARRTLAAN